jgi:hypothetical protein
MCPSVSILTRKDAKRDAFERICLTDDMGDGTRLSAAAVSLILQNGRKAIRFQVRSTQFRSIGMGKLDLKEPIVANDDDVVVC